MVRHAGRTGLLVVSACLIATVVAGCGDDTEPSAEPTTLAPTPTVTDSADTEAVAEVKAAYEAYWDVVIASENDPVEDRSIFEGVATGLAVETQMARIRSLIEDGIHMIGEPEIGEPEISVDGDEAHVEACVDTSTWGAAVGDVTAPPNAAAPRPTVVTMTRADDTWLVSEQLPAEGATITC